MKKGYTLVELLLVCAIVLIICTINVPQFFNKTSYDLTNDLSKLEIIFIYLQQRALATNKLQSCFINLQTNTFSWLKGTRQASFSLTPTLKLGFIPGSHGPPAHPTTPITQPTTFTHTKEGFVIEFFPNGKISSGSIYIIDQNQRIMGALTCGVSQVSYIRRYMYQVSGWIQLN